MPRCGSPEVIAVSGQEAVLVDDNVEVGSVDSDPSASRDPATAAIEATKAGEQPSPDGWRVLLDPAGHPFCVTTLIPGVSSVPTSDKRHHQLNG